MTKKEKPKRLVIHWWEDAYGRHTCHRNEPGLSFKDSLLGHLEQRLDGWHYCIVTQDRVGPFKHAQAARKALEAAVGGASIDIWD